MKKLPWKPPRELAVWLGRNREGLSGSSSLRTAPEREGATQLVDIINLANLINLISLVNLINLANFINLMNLINFANLINLASLANLTIFSLTG